MKKKGRDIPEEALRFKLFRIEQGLTQKRMAELLATKQSLADIERGRVRISGSILEGLVRHFKLNPSWLYGLSDQKYIKESENSLIPSVITMDTAGNENITLVSSKAYAGYPDNLHNPEWFGLLPTFTLPIQRFRNALLRCFQIEGDSMKGIFEPGEYAICKSVEHIQDIQNGKVYILVTEDSLLCKRLSYDPNKHLISLVSVNPDYPIEHLDDNEIKELWEVIGKISPDITMYFPEHKREDMAMELQQLRTDLYKLMSK